MSNTNRNKGTLRCKTGKSIQSNDNILMILKRLLYVEYNSIYETMEYLIKYDDVNLLKIILKFCVDHNINICYQRIFRVACRNGYLNVVEYMVQLGEDQGKEIDIHIYNECAFRYASNNGHLNIVQYLVQLGEKQGNEIDIHAFDECTFRYVSNNGHLNIVQYLIQLGKEQCKEIDIHAKNKEAFRNACSNGHLNVVQYLVLLCPNIYSYNIIDNNKIEPIITN